MQSFKNRRTFAIISHPDAGKTTLTERLLLYAGAIHVAGMVKGKAHQKAATSDWMEIEKERGISVTSTVLQFPYRDLVFNLLDTPGHGDFSEDTYRTLMAADSAIMLIDAAKGVEPRTRDLFNVCKLRKIPIFTLVNKMDRVGLDPMAIIDNIEQELGIACHPAVWPLGSGPDFKAVYRFSDKMLFEFTGNDKSQKCLTTSRPATAEDTAHIQDELDLVAGAATPLTHEKFMAGEVTPVLFGSALTGYGLEVLLDYFAKQSPEPLPRNSSEGVVQPSDDAFSGFVFKIQANTDPKHRDRLAFLRICSGKLIPGDKYYHVRLDRELRATTPQQIFARERQKIEEAVAGDVVGLHDPGIFQVGDIINSGKKFVFDGIPLFSPEHFAKLTLKEPMKRKQLNKGLSDLAEEGAIQVFVDPKVGFQDPYIGAVGKLQFDVLIHRLQHEYNVVAVLQLLPFKMARWLVSDKQIREDYVKYRDGCKMVNDLAERKVLLFRDDWELTWASKENPDIQFIDTIQRAAWAQR